MMFLFKPSKKETKLTDAYRFPSSSPVFHLGATSRIINDAFRKMELFGRFPLFSSPMFDIEQCFAPRSPFLLLPWDRDDATRRLASRNVPRIFDPPTVFFLFDNARKRTKTRRRTAFHEAGEGEKTFPSRRGAGRSLVRRYFSRNPGLGRGRAIAAISNKLFIRNRPR